MEFLTDLPQNQCPDTTFVTQAEGFTPLSPSCKLRAALHLQSGFSARATIAGAGLKTPTRPGLNHQLVSHGEQHRVTASRAPQSCTALFSSVYMKRVHFFFFAQRIV